VSAATQSVKKPKRVFSAFGSLDKAARNWKYLPSVRQSCGELPRGEELLYRMNDATLEVGQGASSFRGFLGLPLLLSFATGSFGVSLLIKILVTSGVFVIAADAGWPLTVFVLMAGLALAIVLLGVFAIAVNDYFGYIDAPLRFDRKRRKVYIWASRKSGPLELDWDSIKPVAQSASAPPYQVNSFRSVLLVDEDANGDVRFEGKLPRIAQIGAAVLDRAHTLAAYEYVRVFMERGPQALPPVKEHLAWRHGVRSVVDIFGFLRASIRGWPQRPESEKNIVWLIVGIVAMMLAAPVFWPFQLSQALALRTTRIPRWPQAYEHMAAEDGPLVPPKGSVDNDPPMLAHEWLVAALWVGSALSVYVWFGSQWFR
jgi:hypothetical protein